MVCKQPYFDCLSFLSESGGDEVTNQCLNSCNFAKALGMEPLMVYLCRRYPGSCNTRIFYYMNTYFSLYSGWKDCLHTCRFLSYDNGTSPASHKVCIDFRGDCFNFKNSKGNIDQYMKCYFNCQINKTENETKEHAVHIYSPISRAYLLSFFHSLPNDKNPGQKLKACYKECEKESATSPEATGHKCDPDSKTCVPCTYGEDCEEDLEDCQETCGKETISPEAGGYKCDLDSMTCVPCTEDEEYCEENLRDCQDTCYDEWSPRLYVINVYRPPRADQVSDTYILEQLRKSPNGPNIMTFDDFNSPGINWDTL
nr:unnamed protein product [Spirometra erinaceieuropaei]